ncbi:hypothetical protein P4B35_13520 [Pontiellaceae bacterium B12227]|nr:hypothetical protein [Pontiellaceae bacterium B12227]
MFRSLVLLSVLLVFGCASVQEGAYEPYKSREKKAFARADRSVEIIDVQTNFYAYVETEVAWAGLIEDIQFKETERTIQVAFSIEHRAFDWLDHGGAMPYQLSAEGQGSFRAGWTVDKPARISHLKTLAKPGYMIVIYGKPYRMEGGVIQLAATAVRPIKNTQFAAGVPMSGKISDAEQEEQD